MNALLQAFGTEMNILHGCGEAEIASVVGADLASMIVQARSGILELSAGGGGTYGKVVQPRK
jgi:PHP family Zn ribbon phosphoesterase